MAQIPSLDLPPGVTLSVNPSFHITHISSGITRVRLHQQHQHQHQHQHRRPVSTTVTTLTNSNLARLDNVRMTNPGWGGYASPSVYDFTSAPIVRTCAVGQDPFYGTIMTVPGGTGETMMRSSCDDNYSRMKVTRSGIEGRGYRGSRWKKNLVAQGCGEVVDNEKERGVGENASTTGDDVDIERGGGTMRQSEETTIVEEVRGVGEEEYDSSVSSWEPVGGIGEIYGLGEKRRKRSLVEGLKLGRNKARRKKKKDRSESTNSRRTSSRWGIRGLKDSKDLESSTASDRERPKTDKLEKSKHSHFMRRRSASLTSHLSSLREYELFGDPKLEEFICRNTSTDSSQESTWSSQGTSQKKRDLTKGRRRSAFFGNGTPIDVLSSRSSNSYTSVCKDTHIARRRSLSSPKSSAPDRKRNRSSGLSICEDMSESKRIGSSSSDRSKSSDGCIKSGPKLSFSFLSMISSRKHSTARPPPNWETGEDTSEVEQGSRPSDWKPSDYANDDYVVFIEKNGSPLKPKRTNYFNRLVTGKV